MLDGCEQLVNGMNNKVMNTHENRIKQQQKSKNHLCNMELEEAQTATYHYQRYYLHKDLIKKQADFRQLSDWTNSFKFPEQPTTHYPNIEKQLQQDKKMFNFLNTARYNSSLLPNNNKNQRLQLSPIVVKFNAKVLSINLQKSREKLIRKLKEDPYMTRYQSLNLMFERGRKNQVQHCRQIELKNVKMGNSHEIHPKTQRISSIFRLMKKQEAFRIKHKKLSNPQNLVTTKLIF